MLGAVVLLLLAAAAGAQGTAHTLAGTGVLSLGGGLATGSNRASLLMVSTASASAAARQKGRSLVYFAGTDVNTEWNTGVPYAEAARHGWLLKDASGDLLVNSRYPSNYVGDVGNPQYQRAWLRNVLAFLARHHDDGVLIDDVLYDLEPLTETEASAYPTQQAWAAAQLSFIRAVGPALRSRGYYVLVNAAGYVPGDARSDTGANTATWWRELAPYVSGFMNEYFAETPDGNGTLRSTGGSWSQNWDGWQRLVRVAQSVGRDFVGVTYGDPGDTRAMSYAKASFLLDWNGGGGAFVFDATEGRDAWNSAWTQNIGLPLDAKRRVGSGWLRRYSAGLVLINPSPTSTQSFVLPGRYVTADGQVVTSATLPPTQALILQAAA